MEPTLPAIHALHLAELMRRWNVPSDRLFEGLSISEAALSDPSTRLPIPTVERLVARARELSGEPGIGFHLGLQMRISAHGELGIAAMTASTVREALEVATRFAPTRTTAIALRFQLDEGVASLIVEERAPLGTARDVILFALIVGIWQIGNALTGRALEGGADLVFEEPSYFRRFADFAPGAIRFDQPVNRMTFDASILDLPLVMSDPAAQRIAREQCERALDALGHQAQLLTRVRALSAREEGGFHSLAQVAKRMHMSGRTLKRRLQAQGTTYSRLVEEQRREAAQLLLQSSDVSIEEVAQRLGYSDAANFTRAFRRWTGASPRAFRRGVNRHDEGPSGR